MFLRGYDETQTMGVKDAVSSHLAFVPQEARRPGYRTQEVGITVQTATKVLQLFLYPLGLNNTS